MDCPADLRAALRAWGSVAPTTSPSLGGEGVADEESGDSDSAF